MVIKMTIPKSGVSLFLFISKAGGTTDRRIRCVTVTAGSKLRRGRVRE